MVVSVHVADVGLRAALIRPPKPANTPGLVQANVGLCAPLGPRMFPAMNFRRIAMVAFWDDKASYDQFLADGPLAETLASGWNALLEPIRAFGTWPGLSNDVPRARAVPCDGPVVVTTLAKVKMPRILEFLSTSAKAEARVVTSPGMRWSTGFGLPPFVATLSVWDSAEAAMDYAYGNGDEAGAGAGASNGAEHPEAMDVDRARTFHHQKAFIRYRPLEVSGTVDGLQLIDPVNFS